MSIPLITPNLARVVLAHPKSNAGRKTIATRYGVIDLTRTRSAHWLAEVNVVVRQSNAARQFAASSWLDGRSNGKAISEAKASFPSTALAGASGSSKFCIAEVRPGQGGGSEHGLSIGAMPDPLCVACSGGFQ